MHRVRPQRLLVVELRVALAVAALEQQAYQREASGASSVLLELLGTAGAGATGGPA